MLKILIVAISSSLATFCYCAETCDMAQMEKNLTIQSEATPDSHNIYRATDPSKVIYLEKRLPCTHADILNLGFELKSSQRFGPKDSTNGGYEDVMAFQKGKLLVYCYTEYFLKGKGPKAKTVSADTACQQFTQPRAFQK